ncbi:hypothetical protein FXO37_19575 [Capsicum annuum]|nr:hypothetical protein FXO37_19575 [Capsicum annuum]
MDVKTAFLHGDLDEEIYMEQLEGFGVKGKENYVCKLKKSLYDLKQALGQCYRKIQKLNQELSKSFSMKDLGPARQILGMQIVHDRKAKKLWLSQEKYIQKVLRRFNMDKAKVVSTPLAMHYKLSPEHCPSSDDEKEDKKKVPYASAAGSLMYAIVCTKLDIAHAVGGVSRFLSNSGREHWNAVKWIMRYFCGTSSLSLCFGTGKPILCGYTDSDMAGDVDTRKSTSGYLVTFVGGVVSWQSRLQKFVALSTTEVELIAAVEACKEFFWMKRFLGELGCAQERYHWIRDVLDPKLLELEKIHTDDNGSDRMTKLCQEESLKIEETWARGVRDIKQRHMASLLTAVEKNVGTKLQEKDIELENINRKNRELVERMKQVAAEAQNWCYRAKCNESLVGTLKMNLQQAMQSAEQGKEGSGDNELDDAVSYIDPNDRLSIPSGSGKCTSTKKAIICKSRRNMMSFKDIRENGYHIKTFDEMNLEYLGKLIVRPSPTKVEIESPTFLECIHGDIFGPIYPPSGSFRYFMVLIDASSRWSHVCLLSSRNLAFAKLLAQIIRLRAQFPDNQIKSIRLDNAVEFSSQAFNDYCLLIGIRVEHPVPHVHTQYGLVELLIKRLQLIARPLLMKTKLPTSVWGHAILHAATLKITNQMPDAFTDLKRITKSHIPAENVPIQIDVSKGPSTSVIANESKARLKRGRPLGSKDRNLRKKKQMVKMTLRKILIWKLKI